MAFNPKTRQQVPVHEMASLIMFKPTSKLPEPSFRTDRLVASLQEISARLKHMKSPAGLVQFTIGRKYQPFNFVAGYNEPLDETLSELTFVYLALLYTFTKDGGSIAVSAFPDSVHRAELLVNATQVVMGTMVPIVLEQWRRGRQ